MVSEAVIDGIVSIITDVGSFAVGAGVFGWIAKNAINNYFDKRLTEHQTELDKEVSEFRNELEKETLQFSQLHEKRAEFTGELYQRFVEFEDALRDLTHLLEQPSDDTKEEELDAAAKAGNNFLNYYMKRKIYFPKEICNTIEEAVEESMEIVNEQRIQAAKSEVHLGPEDFEKEVEHWERVTEEDIPDLKEDLEEHFRELLGVEIDK
jgi:lipopolysaccharide biosynthesis regulator YciM